MNSKSLKHIRFRSCHSLAAIMMFVTMVFFNACGSGNESLPKTSSPAYGNIRVKLVWQANDQGAKAAPARAIAMNNDGTINCERSMIETMYVTVYDENDKFLKDNKDDIWDCGDHVGTIEEVPAGEDRTVSMSARNKNGTELYRGRAENVPVHPDDTDPSPITVEMFPARPDVMTQAASSVAETSAILNGLVNPNGLTTYYYFEFGVNENYGSSTRNELAGSQDSNIAISEGISGLSENTTYHYRLVGTADSAVAYGSDMMFSTDPMVIIHTVAYTAGANGFISGDTPQSVLSGGASRPMEAVPFSGYQFAGWTGDYIGSENPLTLSNIDGDMAVRATFEPIPMVPVPEINVRQGTVSIPSGGSHSFDDVIQGQTGDAVTFTIENSGTADLNLTGETAFIDISGDHADDFVIIQPASASVAPEEYITFTIAFSPASSGSRSAQITITNNDASEGAYEIHLTGTAKALSEVTWYKDADDDAYSDGTSQVSLIRPGGEYYLEADLAAVSGDCDDGDSRINPGAKEICGDGIDQDCSGEDMAFCPMVAVGEYHSVGLKEDGTVVAVGSDEYGQLAVGEWSDIRQVAAGYGHTMGLKADGTIVAVGYEYYNQLSVGDWEGIDQVAAGNYHTVGLKSDGTVLAVGADSLGQLAVGDWTDIVQVAAGEYHTVGLKEDGTVVAAGDSYYGQLSVSDWTGIVQVAAGYGHTVGLRSDGTVVAVGSNSYNQREVRGWVDIVHVAAGENHTLGLKADGTVVAAGDNKFRQLAVDDWSDIDQIVTGKYHTLGVKADGTVTAAGNNYYGQLGVRDWPDIEQVSVGYDHTVGLVSGNTVLALGDNFYGQLDVDDWSDIVQVTAGYRHTVGLKSDGTALIVGWGNYGKFDLSGWTGIEQVASCHYHIVGKNLNGRVVAVGNDDDGQLSVEDWSDIESVGAGEYHTVGLKSDGTVVAVGSNEHGQLAVEGWSGIRQIATGDYHTVGLQSDGRVLAVGSDNDGQLAVGSWSQIRQVAAGPGYTVGLNSYGAVHVTGSLNLYVQSKIAAWTDIVDVKCGQGLTVGRKSDGTVIVIYNSDYGQLEVSEWELLVR